MTQGGERRERKGFEPPPWEREAFEELAQRAARPADAGGIPETPAIQAAPPVAAAPSAEPEPQPQGDAGAAAGEGADGLPAEFHALFETLRGEEAGSRSRTDAVGAWGGLAVGVFGVVLCVWGAAGIVRGEASPLAITMGVSLMCVGGLFAAAGGWLAMKSLKRQGEL